MSRFTVELLVNNKFGVLNRITGLYAKRCYNIDSLVVGATEDQRYSKMVIVSTGDAYMRTQVVAQLEKLYDVKKVELIEEDRSIIFKHSDADEVSATA